MDPDWKEVEEVKEEVKEEEKKVLPPREQGVPKPPVAPQPVTPVMRKIVIATDGTNIKLESADVSGQIELIAVLENVAKYLKGEK